MRMLVNNAAGESRVAQLGLTGRNRIVLLGVALAASSIAAHTVQRNVRLFVNYLPFSLSLM